MEIKNIEVLYREIRKIGIILKKNKKNPDWIRLVNKNKNTTEADFKIDTLLRFVLQKKIDDIPYYSEEVPHNIKDRSDKYWLADPIDGTSSWLEGFNGYVIQAAYVVNNRPTFAFIYWPEKEKFYHCMKNNGCFLNLKKFNSRNNQKTPLRVIDNYPEPRGMLKKFIKQFSHIKYMEMGSLGLKSLLVATGVCDLFFKTTRFRDWDVMPASLFLEEINYKMLYLDTNSFNFGSQIEFDRGLLVYNPFRVEEKMVNYIKNLDVNFDI